MEYSIEGLNFQKIIDRIADAFSVFDFSYIISGGCTLVLLCIDFVFIHKFDLPSFDSFGIYALSVFLSYVCGLVVWAIGHTFRTKLWDKEEDFKCMYERILNDVLKNCEPPFTKSSDDGETSNKLGFSYIWSWLQLRTSNKVLDEKIRLINRYWIMQAVFEGMIGVVFVSYGIGLDYIFTILQHDFLNFLPMIYSILFFIVSVILIVLFGCEAQRYARTQVIDIIALYYIVKTTEGVDDASH